MDGVTENTTSVTDRLTNDLNSLDPSLRNALDVQHSNHLSLLQMMARPDPSPDKRKALNVRREQLYHAFLQPLGLDISQLRAGLQALREEETGPEAKAAFDVDPHVWQPFEGIIIEPKTEPTDHSFWWSQTQPILAPGNRTEFRDDGLHFYGGPNIRDHNGDLITNFGATSTYILSPRRMPVSPSGWFVSSPYGEVFGGVESYAPNWDVLQGDGIAECTISLRQTLCQFAFDADGPRRLIVAETTTPHPTWRTYDRNRGAASRSFMPGSFTFPSLRIHQDSFSRSLPLVAVVEVRFNVHLSSAGAHYQCSPEAIFRFFQWAMTAA